MGAEAQWGRKGVPPLERQRRQRIVYIVLPAYNEAENLGTLAERIDQAMDFANLEYHIILVDDGSKDATFEVVKELRESFPLTSIHHDVNLGLGAAIKSGLIKASEVATEFDVVVTMDADDSHSPGLIARMVRMIGEGFDVVIASRFREGSQVRGVPLSRQALSKGASLLLSTLFPIRGVRDYTCGFRAYRSEVLRQAFEIFGERFFSEEGFQCMVDILLKLRTQDLVFGEVPFVLRYDQKKGLSKMNVRRTVVRTLDLIYRRKTEGLGQGRGASGTTTDTRR